jgi:hypothetical protein
MHPEIKIINNVTLDLNFAIFGYASYAENIISKIIPEFFEIINDCDIIIFSKNSKIKRLFYNYNVIERDFLYYPKTLFMLFLNSIRGLDLLNDKVTELIKIIKKSKEKMPQYIMIDSGDLDVGDYQVYARIKKAKDNFIKIDFINY